jgi:predicted P-loop ATPase
MPRTPYGSRIIESPRSWGTTNADEYLKDESGGRRFWPIKVGKVNIDELANDRDQLWAEAVVLFDAKFPWWLAKSEIQAHAELEQQARYVGDPWERVITHFVNTSTSNFVTIEQVLTSAIQLQTSAQGQAEKNRVARSLKTLGLSRVQVRETGGGRSWVYRKPRPTNDEARCAKLDGAGERVSTAGRGAQTVRPLICDAETVSEFWSAAGFSCQMN